MEPKVLLAELRTLADTMPDFGAFKAWSREHHEWTAKTAALIHLWDQTEGERVTKGIREDLGSTFSSYHNMAISRMVSALHRAIKTLELSGVAQQGGLMFGPGAVYDFFKALNDLLSSATKNVFVIDPYLDDEVFDTYLVSTSKSIQVRLLTKHKASNLKAALNKFIAQTGMTIEIRESATIHDRVIFVDERSCWVLGQSIKDAAKTKPTYLAPLDHDTVLLKLSVYEDIWKSAIPI
jgi:hypothetical protein